jgi:hypothetical protein
LDWRGGIFAEDRVDDHGQRPDDGAPSAASSASSRRKLRSRRPTKDRAQKKRPRGDRAGQEEHWCEFVQSLNAKATTVSRSSLLFLTRTLSLILSSLSQYQSLTLFTQTWTGPPTDVSNPAIPLPRTPTALAWRAGMTFNSIPPNIAVASHSFGYRSRNALVQIVMSQRVVGPTVTTTMIL